MQLWPAIDLLDGNPVRLFQGSYEHKTDYGEKFSLDALAKTFSSFAHGIHVVDLNGAKNGKISNMQAIETIVNAAKIPVEVGGGIRTLSDAEALFARGVSRIILGTSALQDPEFLKNVLEKFGPEKIVVGVDAKNGNVAIHGWEKTSEVSAINFIGEMENLGVKTIIFTDISTDGTLQGPATETIEELVKTFPLLSFVASGGISGNDDLKTLEKTGVKGVIFGKAFYEGKIDIEKL